MSTTLPEHTQETRYRELAQHRARMERASNLAARVHRADRRATELWGKRRRAILGQRPRRFALLNHAHVLAVNEFSTALSELADFARELSRQLAEERMGGLR